MTNTLLKRSKSIWSHNNTLSGIVTHLPLWSPSCHGLQFESIDPFRHIVTRSGSTMDSNGFYGDGSNDLTIPDHDMLSFGDGTSDVPFTIWAFVNMVDATGFRLVGKMAGTIHREYYLGISGVTDKVAISIFDKDDAGGTIFIGTEADAALTGYEGIPILISVTYDGAGLNTGIAFQINGVAVAVTPSGAGIYTSMQNYEHPVKIGSANFSGATSYSNGTISDVGIVRGRVLPNEKLLEIYNKLMVVANY